MSVHDQIISLAKAGDVAGVIALLHAVDKSIWNVRKHPRIAPSPYHGHFQKTDFTDGEVLYEEEQEALEEAVRTWVESIQQNQPNMATLIGTSGSFIHLVHTPLNPTITGGKQQILEVHTQSHFPQIHEALRNKLNEEYTPLPEVIIGNESSS